MFNRVKNRSINLQHFGFAGLIHLDMYLSFYIMGEIKKTSVEIKNGISFKHSNCTLVPGNLQYLNCIIILMHLMSHKSSIKMQSIGCIINFE